MRVYVHCKGHNFSFVYIARVEYIIVFRWYERPNPKLVDLKASHTRWSWGRGYLRREKRIGGERVESVKV
jgi:hypothetical protein